MTGTVFRPSKEEGQQIHVLHNQGESYAKIARMFGVSARTIKRFIFPYLKEEAANKRIEYLNTEEGFIGSKWCDIKKRLYTRKMKLLTHTLTRDEFLDLWEEHKKQYGINCYYTGLPLKMVRKPAVKGAKKRHPTPRDLLSVDRFDSGKGYTKDNVVFCSWGFNDRKSSISVEDCYLIIKRHEERTKKQ